MVTTPTELRNAIAVVGGKVVVTAATLGSDAVTALIKTYGKSDALTITGASIASEPDDDFVLVQGAITLAGVAVSGVTRFYLDGTTAHLDLPGTPPAGWTLATSFADLKNSSIAQQALGTPTLRLHSQQIGDAAPGLSLDAGFSLPPALEVIRWFADPGASAKIAGPITLDSSLPVMTLTISPTIHASLGTFATIDLAMQYVSQTYRKSSDAKPVVVATPMLAGNLGFEHAGKQVPVPLQASFGENTGLLNLRLTTASAFDIAFSEITGWLGGTDLGTGLPDFYRPSTGITLHDVDFAIGLISKSLESVSLTFQTTQDWTIVGNLVVRQPLVLQFMLMPGQTPALMSSIEGTLQFGDALALDIYAQYPDFLVRGQLPDGEPVDLLPLIQYLGGVTTAWGDQKLQIDVLSFEAHPAASFYSFDIDVIGDWQIVKALALTGLRASVQYDDGAVHLLFEGRFIVGGADFMVSAEYDSEAGGWLLSGEAGNDAPLQIGKFIQNLVGDFSSTAAQALPDFISTLEISHLGVTFDTATKDFDFRCETKLEIDGTPLDLTLHVSLKNKGDDSYTHLYAGKLVIGSLAFELVFEDAKTGTTSTSTLLAALQPSGGVDVRALVAGISADAGALMPELTLSLENALFLYRKSGTADATYLFGLAIGLDLNLQSLPLVGPVLADAGIGGIKDVQALYTSAGVTANDVTAFNALLTEAGAKPPLPIKKGATGTTQVLSKGFNFAANLDMGNAPIALTAGGASAPPNPPANAPAPAAPAAAKPPSGNASWFAVNRSIGPATLERIGVRYENGRVWLLVDADFTLAGLALGLQGLALGTRLDDPAAIAVNLDGMSLEFASGPLTIAGGFLHVGDDYLGEAQVQAGPFGLTAIGGYAPADQSFFIFARLAAPLGGPPFFFVTGIAAGFGVNRQLKLPPIDDLQHFALLPANNNFPTTLGTDNPGKTLATTLGGLADEIPPRAGMNWAAAGIDFTSFEMVDSSALATVAFGVDFSIALLGITRVTIPKADPEPIVYLEITLEAQFKPSAGLLSVDGRLTPASFVFAKLCRITGGFAFYLWFAGDNEGDFVISIGGYHPRFNKPPHYPVVPRLQLTYQIGNLVITGQSYLALTPHMVMAGMRIDATWESGSLKAWFSAGIDFLLGWRPFHYEADAYVHIGVSLTIDLFFTSVSITIHVGVDLSIWGPQFGGSASIDLDIVSFTIHFGADPRQDAVDWAGFTDSFLPKGKTDNSAPAHLAAAAFVLGDAAPADHNSLWCTGSVSDGLVRDLKAADSTSFFSWLVDANQFALQTNTLIPAKAATYNMFDLQAPFTKDGGFKTAATGDTPTALYNQTDNPDGIAWSTEFGVLPMELGADAFKTHMIVQLLRPKPGSDHTNPANYVDAIDSIAVTPLVKPASAALWAKADSGLNGDRLIPNALVGLQLSPMAQHPDITFQADLWAMLFDQGLPITWQPAVPARDTSDSYDGKPIGATLSFMLGGNKITCADYMLSALTLDSVAQTRKATVAGLASLGLALDPAAIDVKDLATYPLWDWPAIRTLGEERAA